jgi:hypothetical protein
MVSNPPVTVYHERGLELQREFRLFSTELQVVANGSFGSRAEMTIPLAQIRPVPNQIWTRHRIFLPFLIMTILSAFVGVVCLVGSLSSEERVIGGIGGMAGFTIFGILTLLVSNRVEYRQFMSESDMVAFDVGATGPEKRHFPEFVESVCRAIKSQRAQPNASAPAPNPLKP